MTPDAEELLNKSVHAQCSFTHSVSHPLNLTVPGVMLQLLMSNIFICSFALARQRLMPEKKAAAPDCTFVLAVRTGTAA